MAGGHWNYRHLGRKSSARQALLRGLVTQLVEHEHIHTTYAKAKEAQRLAEKLLTLARKNTETSRRSAQGILYTPDLLLPKLFGEIRERYMERGRGCTRVTRTEPKLHRGEHHREGEYAILELVDGPKDSRFMMTAKAIARDRYVGKGSTPLTLHNVDKVTRYRGTTAFDEMVAKFMRLQGKTVSETAVEMTADGWAGEGGSMSENKVGKLADGDALDQPSLAEREVGRMALSEEEKTRKVVEGFNKR